MTLFTEFNWKDLEIEEQLFADYTSKYLDLKEKLNKDTATPEKTSILNDIDFELELIRRDTINVTYILQLLITLKSKQTTKDKEAIEKEISNLLNTEVSLRSKRELIEKFIQENLPLIEDTDAITEEFDKFWVKEQESALENLVETENLYKDQTEKLIENFLFSEREPLRDDLLSLRKDGKPSVLKFKETGDRILNKIIGFVDTFVNGFTGH